MARDKNTYAKRQRETLKRHKAEAKQERRRIRKEQTGDPDAQIEPSDDVSDDVSDSVREEEEKEVGSL
ncbi:MAG: hypothetical protein K8R46_13915 [Pirellulales bacterium]|nr:hypothetical protein [Pirellulales bacterium]